MSANAEAKGHAAALNKAEWEALTDQERAAVRAAIRAYSQSPGDSINVAMLRGIRAYDAAMKATMP